MFFYEAPQKIDYKRLEINIITPFQKAPLEYFSLLFTTNSRKNCHKKCRKTMPFEPKFTISIPIASALTLNLNSIDATEEINSAKPLPL